MKARPASIQISTRAELQREISHLNKQSLLFTLEIIIPKNRYTALQTASDALVSY